MNLVARLRFGSGMIAAVLALLAPATLAAQTETTNDQTPIVAIATLSGSSELPSAPSERNRTTNNEVANALPAGPAMGSPTAIPASPALIVPIRNEQKIGESRPTLPKKTFLSLAALQHSAVAFDTWSTRRLVNVGGHELNPLLKPVANSDAMYPVMQIWPFAIDYLAVRMAKSNKPWMRKMWWVPQTASAASSFIIGARNVSLANSSQKLVK